MGGGIVMACKTIKLGIYIFFSSLFLVIETKTVPYRFGYV